MGKKVEQMLRDLIQLAEQEFGTSAAPDAVHRMMAQLSQRYGGERVYVEKLPKLISNVRIAAMGTGLPGTALANELHLSVRQVRRIVRGR